MIVQTGRMWSTGLWAAARRLSPRSMASATASDCGTEKQTVALMSTPS